MLCESCGSGRDPLTHTSLNPWEGGSHTHLSQSMGGGGNLSHTPFPTHGSGRDPLTHTSLNPLEGGSHTHLSQPMGVGGTLSHTSLPTHGRGALTHISPNPWEWE